MKLILIAICGLALVGCFDGMGNQRADQQGETVVGQVKARAQDEVCMTNLRTIRQAIEVQKTSGDDALPTSISDLRLGGEFSVCPIDKKPYEYDPTTGKVKCNHPGHAKY